MSDNMNELALENKKLKQIITELSIERDKYKKLFEVSADALSIIDLSSGKFIECNQSAIDMHGVQSNDNFLNLSPSDLSPEFQPCGQRSEELARAHIEKAVKHGAEIFQWTHSHLDGTTFLCLVSLSAIYLESSTLILAIGRDISDLVKVQKELKVENLEKVRFKEAYLDEKEKFEKFVELAPIGIAINSITDGSFEFVNQQFGAITGYTVEELNSMDYWQLTPIKYEAQEQEQLQSLDKFGRYGPYYKEYIQKSGDKCPVLLSGIKITDNKNRTFIWSVVQDMSHQKEVEREIQAAKDKADAVALRMQIANDSAGIGVWDWDLITGELVWDSWMYKLYGVDESQVSGISELWQSNVHPDDIDVLKSQLEAAISGNGSYEPEFRVVHPNGDIRNMKANAEVLRDSHSKAIKMVGVNYDITEKVNIVRTLSEAKVVAENATQSKSDFLANMSHEIRTPMNAILGGLQLLKNVELTDELSMVLKNASFSAQSLLTIINDILDYSKIESNKLELENVQFSLTEVLNSVKYDLDSTVSEKRIAFIINQDKSYNEYWSGDLVRVKQIVLNLATNAVKFTEKGSVTINIGSQVYLGNPAINLEIIDTGIGMSKKATEGIFERFTQADTSTTRKFGGTGLGMSISISLIKMMNGTIDIESIPGEGTAVKVILPLTQVDFTTENKTKKALSAPHLDNKKILIAEDNNINKVLIKTILKATNAELKIVENGQLAVDAIKQEEFDLVLMDIHMPVMDGIEAQQKIKEIFPELPVIALTANIMENDVENYYQHGFVAHIAKPIDINKLYGSLKRLFDA